MNEAPTVSAGPFIFGFALFAAVWAWFAVPFTYHAWRAVRAGDPWVPFDRKPNGKYTFLASTRSFSAFRAPERSKRTRFGLIVRYAIWLGAIAGLAVAPIRILQMIQEL